VRDLKSTLQAQAEDRDLDKALLELEEERNNSARLRLKVEDLRQDLQDAYDKRDTVRERVESLEQEVEQLEYDKEVIIKQKRHLQARIEELQRELKELRMQRDEQMYEQVLGAMPIEEMDSEWEQAREGIRNHIHSVLSILRAEPQSQVELDRDKLWQDWVEQEMSLVEKGLVELDAYSETGRLPSTATFNEAQNLLMLRWYLLEYMRQAIEFTKMNAFPV
jgi:chromosome segregation ATPase